MSKLYYGSIVKIFENIKICNSNNDVLSAIDHWIPNDTNKKPYILNNRENIKQFLNTHIYIPILQRRPKFFIFLRLDIFRCIGLVQLIPITTK